MKDPAFILGNGPSRLVVDLDKLKPQGTIWGCNALYRDFTPHYLVSVDKAMQDEIHASGYCEKHQVIFRQTPTGRYPYNFHKNIYVYNTGKQVPNNSGVGALYFALKQGHRKIYLLGFDFKTPELGEVQNIYKGTRNYKSSPRYREPIPRCISDWIEKNYKTVEFIRVVDKKLSSTPNFRGLSEPYTTNLDIGEFCEQYQCHKVSTQ